MNNKTFNCNFFLYFIGYFNIGVFDEDGRIFRVKAFLMNILRYGVINALKKYYFVQFKALNLFHKFNLIEEYNS